MLKYINPILLLVISNVFMTFAWYGHLRHKSSALWIVILVSWLIAFLEYCYIEKYQKKQQCLTQRPEGSFNHFHPSY